MEGEWMLSQIRKCERRSKHMREQDIARGEVLGCFFYVILFILSIFIQGAKSPASLSVWFLIHALSRGSQRGHAAESCEHRTTETLRGRSNYHCMYNHKSWTITHTIRHLFVAWITLLSFRPRCTLTIKAWIKKQTWLTGSIIMKC